ncbi:MAG TPA: hypothetical protein DD473_06325 [Planctomycetaceae bacterium]|nr:hypothetical protein [Planctomycetaceae bacterium]
MLFLGIKQHARHFTVSLRDQQGDVLLARQVSTRPGKNLQFFDQLIQHCAQLYDPLRIGLTMPLRITVEYSNFCKSPYFMTSRISPHTSRYEEFIVRHQHPY